MRSFAMHVISDAKNLNMNEKYFLTLLCLNSDETNYNPFINTFENIMVPMKKLVQKMSCSRSVAYKSLASLIALGIIENTKINNHESNIYKINIINII